MNFANNWPYPPPDITLSARDLHVWRAEFDSFAEQKARFWSLLAPDEQTRARRFHFERDKNTFVITRGILRTLLGRYVNLLPRQIQFAYSAHGKPTLPPPPTISVCQFNVSHTQGVALFAFCRQTPVGVDVERIRPLPDAPQIAARFFSPSENKSFLTVPAAQRDEAFFNCWTRKEAFIKAVGDGLSYPLDAFDVAFKPGEPARFLHIQGSAEEAACWSLFAFAPAADYVGATAVSGHNWRLSTWTFPST